MTPRRGYFIQSRLSRRAFLRAMSMAGLTTAIDLVAGCTRSPSKQAVPTSSASSAAPLASSRTPATVTPTVASQALSPTASAYLDEALDYLQAHALKRDQVSWPMLRLQARANAQGAQTPADTYPAIRFALQQLNDQHSKFLEPAEASRPPGRRQDLGFVTDQLVITVVFPGTSAAQAGVRVGDVVEAINGVAGLAALARLAAHPIPATLTLRRPGGALSRTVTLTPSEYDGNRTPTGWRLTDDLGYLEVPAFSGNGDRATWYATTMQEQIRAVDAQSVRGWVVDLRRNWGGNLAPMGAGVGPILGEGLAGRFVDATGRVLQIWSYRAGQAVWDVPATGQEDVGATVAGPAYRLHQPLPPVAILTSRQTASAGEAVVVAFRGRPKTRSFGASTYGIPSATDGKRLRDGATIVFTIALDADRTGRVYDQPIPPNQSVMDDWAVLGTEHDPVLQAARIWLRHHGNEP